MKMFCNFFSSKCCFTILIVLKQPFLGYKHQTAKFDYKQPAPELAQNFDFLTIELIESPKIKKFSEILRKSCNFYPNWLKKVVEVYKSIIFHSTENLLLKFLMQKNKNKATLGKLRRPANSLEN